MTDLEQLLVDIRVDRNTNLKPENLRRGVNCLGVYGTYDIETVTEDATARPEDVLSSKTFYANGVKQTGTIETVSTTISGGMTSTTIINGHTAWVASVNDELGIALVYTYDGGDWSIFKWENCTCTTKLQALTSGNYPSGSLMKSAAISQQLNERGFVNIWCHAINSNTYSDDMRGYLGVFQYDVANNRIVAKKTIETSKPGGYSKNWNENGNMSPDPTNPNRCFVSYGNNNQQYMQLLVYSPTGNSLSRYSCNAGYTNGPCYSSEWNDTGDYVLVCRGSKTHPEQNTLIKVASDNKVSIALNYTNSKPSAIYKHYIIEGNKIYDIATHSKVLAKTWSEYSDIANGTGCIWVYLNYLFVVSYTNLSLTVFKIHEDLSLTKLFMKESTPYVSSSYARYVGSLLVPVSNTFLYFSPETTKIYKFELLESTDKVTELTLQGDRFITIYDANVTDDKVLLGSVYYGNEGRSIGSMPNLGNLEYTPMVTSQTLPKGYITGGTISPVTSDIDSNILPQNIKLGVNILGVEGTLIEGAGDDTSDANLQAKYLLEGYSMVSSGQLIEGTMRNYGTVTITPDDVDKEIPTGYYDSLSIPAIVASTCAGYTQCLEALEI